MPPAGAAPPSLFATSPLVPRLGLGTCGHVCFGARTSEPLCAAAGLCAAGVCQLASLAARASALRRAEGRHDALLHLTGALPAFVAADPNAAGRVVQGAVQAASDSGAGA